MFNVVFDYIIPLNIFFHSWWNFFLSLWYYAKGVDFFLSIPFTNSLISAIESWTLLIQSLLFRKFQCVKTHKLLHTTLFWNGHNFLSSHWPWQSEVGCFLRHWPFSLQNPLSKWEHFSLLAHCLNNGKICLSMLTRVTSKSHYSSSNSTEVFSLSSIIS